MKENNERAPQQGSGSAENKGENRSQQQNRSSNLPSENKKSIGSEIGSGQNSVSDLRDLGALSGRDDASGGSGDRMEDQSTGEGTSK